MGIPGYWTEVLGVFKYRPHEELSKDKFATVGVDIDILFNKSVSDITQFATTNSPQYPSPDILEKVKEYHAKITSAGVIPVYVFGGPAPLLKKEEKERRLRRREGSANEWITLLDRVKNDPNVPLSDKEVHDAIASRRKLSHPSLLDQANVLAWMQAEGIRVVGSFLEADQQLRKLEMDKIVDAIATEDGDLVVLGGKYVLSKSCTRGGKLMFRVFDRDDLYENKALHTHLSKFFLYQDAGVDLALLLGNDYIEKMEGSGPVTVLDDHEWKHHRSKDEEKVLNNGLIDLIAQHGRPEEWIGTYASEHPGRIKHSTPSEYAKRYICARRYVLHAPVFEKDPSTGEITLVPLNPLPPGIDIANWKEYIGFDFEEDAVVSRSQYQDAYECKVVPLSGKPPINHHGPLFSPEENPNVSTNQLLPLFARLNFDEVPVELQPTICLTCWLKCRGWTERKSDNRESIERDVNLVRAIRKVVLPQELQPSAGEYNFMEALTYRDGHNKYDTWNRDYYTICRRLLPIDDNAIDPRVVALIPNSIKRANKLVFGYHYNPQTIECLNVKSKVNDLSCILIRVACLGSKKTKVIHTVHAVFEDRDGGLFLLSPHSTCSCDDGALFCSHMLGFLYLLGIVQDEPSQEAFEEWYVARQELLLATGALLETVVMMDKYNRELAQSDRQAKRKH